MKKNSAFENSLACLQHPLALLSIAVLLLNDHVLKVASPSWLTGKLSDFAGLFFFPFIVAAGLGLALAKFDLSRERIGQIAFGFVAVWFTLLKTSPLVNSLTAQLASVFVGGTAQLILDPTDLMALASMWPAWRMWQKQSAVPLSRRAYVSLAVGVVACLATSPVPVFNNVVALTYQDGILYARSTGTNEIAASTDLGESWQITDVSDEIRKHLNELDTTRQLPIQVCEPDNDEICYMIDGTDKVYASNDGGETWQVDWEIPPSRRDYVFRNNGKIECLDILIVEDRDSQYLFVAMDTNGILRRNLSDGEWIPLAVEKAKPISFHATDIITAMSIVEKELSVWVGVAFLVFLFTHMVVWMKYSPEEGFMSALGWMSATIGLTIVVLILDYVLVSVLAVAFGNAFLMDGLMLLDAGKPIGTFILALAIIALFAWFVIRTYVWVSKHVVDKIARQKLVLYCSLTFTGVYLLGSLPWLLWSFGIIERYQWALFTSISVSILITALGYRLIRSAK